MKSITDDTRGSHGSDVTESSAVGGLRARLERYEQSAGGGIELPVGDPPPEASAESPSPSPAADPISPELALVDPELADRARALLPDPRPFAPPLTIEAAPAVVEEAPPHVEPVPEPEPSRARPARKRRRVAYALVLVLLAAAAAAVGYLVLGGYFSDDVSSPNAVNAPAANPPPQPEPPTAKPPAPVAAARAFVWAPVRGATWYLVQFYRGRTEIFRARPKQARVVVPAHWSYKGNRLTLQPGRYRWSVRPRLGKRYGKPIVLSELVVQRTSSGGGQSTRSP